MTEPCVCNHSIEHHRRKTEAESALDSHCRYCDCLIYQVVRAEKDKPGVILPERSSNLVDKIRRVLDECEKAISIDLRLKTSMGYHDFAVKIKSILEEEE